MSCIDKECKKEMLREYHMTRRNIKQSKCRRVGPAWAWPNELWRVLLNANLPVVNAKAGLGAPKNVSGLKWFRYLLMQILLKIKVEQSSPLSWHKSRVFSLYKKNPALVDVLHTPDHLHKR